MVFGSRRSIRLQAHISGRRREMIKELAKGNTLHQCLRNLLIPAKVVNVHTEGIATITAIIVVLFPRPEFTSELWMNFKKRFSYLFLSSHRNILLTAKLRRFYCFQCTVLLFPKSQGRKVQNSFPRCNPFLCAIGDGAGKMPYC